MPSSTEKRADLAVNLAWRAGNYVLCRAATGDRAADSGSADTWHSRSPTVDYEPKERARARRVMKNSLEFRRDLSGELTSRASRRLSRKTKAEAVYIKTEFTT